MVTIGVDAHKRVHAAVGLDDAGRELGQWRGPNSARGWSELLEWGAKLGSQRQWGIEGAWGYGRGLAQHLVATGELVYEINPRWTAFGRRRARRPGKTDRLDARAVARLVRQEAPGLPQVFADDASAVLEHLTSERESVLAESVRLRNQLHALLLQLDPGYQAQFRSLESQRAVAALEGYQATGPGILSEHWAATVRRLAHRLHLALDQVAELTKEIKACTKEAGFSNLTTICGVSFLTAATLAGILGSSARFPTDSGLAAYAGVAPLEASSAERVRHRVNRGGNRRLNAVIHIVALTQIRAWAPARTYVSRRISEGKTRREAVRALKRYLVRAIWQVWKHCFEARSPAVSHAA